MNQIKERERGIRIRIRMIYSFKTLPLMKRCRWMTYHLHSTYYNYTYEQENQQTNDDVAYLTQVLTMTVWLNYELEMLLNLKALYKHTYKFLSIFSLVDARSRLNRKRLGNLWNFDGINCTQRERENSNSKTLFCKDCSLGSFKNLSNN